MNNSEPEFVPELQFMALFLEQLDTWLYVNYGFTLYERIPELWDDYDD